MALTYRITIRFQGAGGGWTETHIDQDTNQSNPCLPDDHSMTVSLAAGTYYLTPSHGAGNHIPNDFLNINNGPSVAEADFLSVINPGRAIISGEEKTGSCCAVACRPEPRLTRGLSTPACRCTHGVTQGDQAVILNTRHRA